jgi:hypothetical protein
MAGCEPRQLTTVLAAVECLLDPEFNAHGVSATTMGATPCSIVSGPVRTAAGVNSGMGALGSGHRANGCIGRAVKLVLQNCGGAKLGGTESTTLGTPMKYTMCVAEREEVAPEWLPYHVEQHGADPADSVVTMLAVMSGPHQVRCALLCCAILCCDMNLEWSCTSILEHAVIERSPAWLLVAFASSFF